MNVALPMGLPRRIPRLIISRNVDLEKQAADRDIDQKKLNASFTIRCGNALSIATFEKCRELGEVLDVCKYRTCGIVKAGRESMKTEGVSDQNEVSGSLASGDVDTHCPRPHPHRKLTDVAWLTPVVCGLQSRDDDHCKTARCKRV